MEISSREDELAVEKYKLLFELWMAENPIKTNKLQMLMATNSILISAFFLAGQTVWIALAGFLFSFVWILSIGRTLSFQQHWRSQMEDVRSHNSNNAMFQVHSLKIKPDVWGRVPSKYYTLGTPIATTLAWLVVVLYLLLV